MALPTVASAAPRYCADQNASYRGATPFLGIYADLDDRGPADLECTAGRIAAEHFGYVRDELNWGAVETSPGTYYFDFYDQIMAAVARHHLQWLPVVEVAPPWDEQWAQTNDQGIFPPQVGAYAGFLKLLVERYGPRGSFWQTNPGLPYEPIRAWQIWNEPSIQAYWLPRSSAAAYTALLKASYRAIRSVDRHALVVAAGMPFEAGIKFYSQMYRDGARRYFNVLAFQDFSSKVRYATADLIELRRLMNRRGDRRKPIWVTEFGWASDGPPGPFTAGRLTPQRVSSLLHFMLAHRRSLGLTRIFYYNWRDPAATSVDWWGVHMGLYRANDSARPIERVIVSAAARLNRRTGRRR